MTQRPSRIALWACALVMLLAAASVGAEPVQFGARSLNVPSPQGFVPVSVEAPSTMTTLQAYLPPGNRLAEAYALPTAVLAPATRSTSHGLTPSMRPIPTARRPRSPLKSSASA